VGAIKPPSKAKLVVGMLSGDEDLLREAARRLSRVLGTIELTSVCWPFEGTDYYRDELGERILRQFVAFDELVSVERLPEIKRLTNELETRLGEDLALPETARPVNLDPGYLTLSKLVLATTKDYSHRLYLGQGIYGEVTLHYESGAWKPWPWTYPDYAAPTYHGWFTQVRGRLKEQIRV